MITLNKNQLNQKIKFFQNKAIKLVAIGTIDIANIDTKNFLKINTNQEVFDTKEFYKLSNLGGNIYQMELLIPARIKDFVIIETPVADFVFDNLHSFNAAIYD